MVKCRVFFPSPNRNAKQLQNLFRYIQKTLRDSFLFACQLMPRTLAREVPHQMRFSSMAYRGAFSGNQLICRAIRFASDTGGNCSRGIIRSVADFADSFDTHCCRLDECANRVSQIQASAVALRISCHVTPPRASTPASLARISMIPGVTPLQLARIEFCPVKVRSRAT